MKGTHFLLVFFALSAGTVDESALAVQKDKDRFNPQSWRKDNWNRMYQFGWLLWNYNLIGMSEERIVKLLGLGYCEPADYTGRLLTTNYVVENRGGCTPDGILEVQFHFESGRVDSWRFIRGRFLGSSGVCSPWITNNVLLSVSKARLARLGLTEPFPDTKEK